MASEGLQGSPNYGDLVSMVRIDPKIPSQDVDVIFLHGLNFGVHVEL